MCLKWQGSCTGLHNPIEEQMTLAPVPPVRHQMWGMELPIFFYWISICFCFCLLLILLFSHVFSLLEWRYFLRVIVSLRKSCFYYCRAALFIECLSWFSVETLNLWTMLSLLRLQWVLKAFCINWLWGPGLEFESWNLKYPYWSVQWGSPSNGIALGGYGA